MVEAAQYQITGGSASEIAGSVEALVAAGGLAPGARLPAVRRLAGELGVSPATVAAAFRELARRGIVVGQERRGVAVSARPPLAARHPSRPVPPGVRDLATGNPDPALLPDLVAVLRSLDPPGYLYGEEPVVPALVAAIRAELERLGVPAENVCVVSGALDGVERALEARLRPGDRVALEDPCYGSTLDLVRALGLVPVAVPLDDAGMIPGALARALEAGCRALVLTPRGQNPTGAALDAGRAEELRGLLAAAPDVLVVEDDHLGAVAGVPPYTTVGGRERWVFVRSVAKSLGPDLRLAFLAGDAITVARVEGRLGLGPGWVSRLLQHAVLSLLADPATAPLLERAATTYRERREALIGELAARGLETRGRTGLNVWVPVPDEEAAAAALLEAGYAVAPGSRYRLESPPAVRVTTAALDPGEAGEVAAALAGAFAGTRRTRAA
ncbi:MAG: aminotransferase class I/II-fold pyridoxal phosphate-dependent enzyme [Thermoleophilia bacterium]|nr:aminotransferase class I/II-fold pyridoxal phosphate-dependent enzyme [Thermoleophilia bacterium]